jgi:hypothetical protein
MIELEALQGQVKALVEDLRGQVAADAELHSRLVKEYEDAKDGQRTGGTFESWLEGELDQAAVAWVLGCVFVRFCEDNRLVDGLWLGGPEPDAPVERAVQSRQAYLIANPRKNDRRWLREAFGYLGSLPATGKLFDDHNPVWRFGISGRAAEDLSDFFRRGDGLRSLRTPGLDTRFLGDLYQDLSAHARETYALLQTPVFVEEFILDRTFEPAYKEFGLAGTTVIDPTCGSGHFLLGAFDRLVTRWKEREPGTDVRELVQRALHQVTGVDINPFAVAIARFRLMVAALNACGLSSLERAPAFDVRVATGDSLLPWSGEAPIEQPDLHKWRSEKPFAYTSEDEDLLAHYLKPRQYTVVVGNPPYRVVRDPARNKKYRELYSACSGKYHLTVPFAQRFFALALRGDNNGDGAGYVGQIAGNGFMKREFGKKLISEFYANEVELNEAIDTSGAFIPGHGTPTVILVGRNRLVSPRYSGPIRTVLGVRGEPSQPADAAKGLVWSAILDQIDRSRSESSWITVTDAARERLRTHPWSLSGGGAVELMGVIESTTNNRLGIVAESIGITSFTLEDDLYVQMARVFPRVSVPGEYIRPMVLGDGIRDWWLETPHHAIFPYSERFAPIEVESCDPLLKIMWPARTSVANGQMFGKQSKVDAGLRWSEYGRLTSAKLRTPLSIVFAFVATHNHFVLDRGGKVFKQSAPVIKLPEGATEDDHLRLLGVLNSSTACFWLKQVSQPKGGTDNSSGGGNRWSPEPWYERYEFTGTKLQEFPLPAAYSLGRARLLDQLAQRLSTVSPAAVAAGGVPTRQRLAEARKEYHASRAQMIAVQEELDWEVYRLYGLLDDDLTTEEPPELRLGERAFEIVMARTGVQTEWFNRHRSMPTTEPPAEWPEEYRALVERRIAVIESDRNIGLIERPECKRRWATDGWDAMQSKALRDWLLDRLEVPDLWSGAPAPLSVAQLADRVRHDEDFRSVLDLWVGTDQHDLVKTLGTLFADEHVPFLPALRYRPSGLRKRAQWERTWALQRREDVAEHKARLAAEAVSAAEKAWLAAEATDEAERVRLVADFERAMENEQQAEQERAEIDVPVPPKYSSADFVKGSYWRNRGKLDVPKERFISYPGAGREGDDSLLLGWAGWDHLAQAQALATVYLERKTQAAWPAEKLLPILAGLAELEPWLRQWHAEPRPGFPGTPAEFFSGLVDTELAVLGADRARLTELRGVEELV